MSGGRATVRGETEPVAAGCESHLHDGRGQTVTVVLILVGVTALLVLVTWFMAEDLGWGHFTPWVRAGWLASIPPMMVVSRVVQTRRARSTKVPVVSGAGAGGLGVGAYALLPDAITYVFLVAIVPFWVGFMLEYYLFQAQLAWDEHHPLPVDEPADSA